MICALQTVTRDISNPPDIINQQSTRHHKSTSELHHSLSPYYSSSKYNCSLWLTLFELITEKSISSFLKAPLKLVLDSEDVTMKIIILTSAPSRLKMADAPTRWAGAIFLLHRRRRNVSDDRSFLWNFQPMREEYSQPSGSPTSLLYQSETI